FQKRFQELEGRGRGNIRLIRNDENGNYFYLRYDKAKDIDVLYFKERKSNQEIKIFDPSTYPTAIKNISYLEPSYDGSKIAIGFNPNDDFTTTIFIYDLETKKILNDQITQINPDF